MKRYLCWLAVVMVIFPVLILFSQTDPDADEARLARVEGEEKIALLVELTRTYWRREPQKTVNYGQEALVLLNTFPDSKQRAAILNHMSRAYMVLEDNQKAREFALGSLKVATESNNERAIVAARDLLGVMEIRVGEYDKALEYFNPNMDYYLREKDKAGQVQILVKIGGINFEKGKYDKALENYLNALNIYEELNNRRGIGLMNSSIGLIYWELKDLDKSLYYYKAGLKIEEEFNDRQGIASSLNNIGVVYREKKDYKKALDYFQRGLAISQDLEDKRSASALYNSLGYVYREKGENQQALEYFQQALRLNEEVEDYSGVADVSINIASAYQRLGRFAEAIELANKGLEIASRMELKGEVGDAYQVLADTYEAKGDYKNALYYYKKSKEINEKIFNETTTKRIAALQTDFEIERRQKKIELLQKDQERHRIIFSFLILFALLILALAFVIYTRYRLKSRVTRELEQEIHERKQTEQKLRESEAKFRVLAEKSVIGIWIIQDWVIKYANPRCINIFGYSPEEIMGKNPLDLVLEEDRPIVGENLEKRITGASNTMAYEFRGLTKDGETLHLESFGSLTLYQGQPAVLESVIDITRRKRAESELLKSRKMEAIGILAGGIAHDFNNLLAVIVGNTSMLKLSYGDGNPKINNFLDNVEKASAQAADLAQKFITFSEGGWLMRKKVKLATILKEIAHLSPEIKELSCNLAVPPDLDYIHGDERQLRQVMTNLLLNAREATSEIHDKRVSVIAKNINLEKENSLSLKEGKYVQISVKDNGKGIPPDFREKIFDPYFSTKNTVSQKGLGLGLALCYSIVTKHDGHIAITSEVSKGTTVDLFLPVYRR